MATVDMTSGQAYHVAAAPMTAGMYCKQMDIDFAAATTTKGSALALNDVIETLDIPGETLVFAAGIIVKEAMAGTSTDLALDLGVTGGDVDVFVDGFDFDAAAVGDQATPAFAGTNPTYIASDDTLDILIQAQTGTFTGGKITVWALCVDISGRNNPGIAAAGS